MKKAISAIAVMAAFIVSTLSVPIALADESVVGIVYRGWSDQECKSAFGNYPYIISNVDDLGLTDPKLKDARGPLLYQGQESGCYCGREPNANQPSLSRDYIMSEEKTSCVMCSRYDRNAVYYTDSNATDAVVKVKDKDVGCRCAAMEGVSKTFDKLENGKCVYKDKTADNNRCQAQFGTSGVRVCTSTSGETQLGLVSGVACCCEPGYEKLLDATKVGGYNCTGTGRTAAAAVCVNEGKARGMMEGVDECPSDLKGVLTNPSATQAQKDRFNQIFAFSTATTQCCCGTGYLFSGGKCIKDVDECGQIVQGSVKQGRPDTGTIKVGDKYMDKFWDTNKTEAIQKAKLTACYCKKNTLPADKQPNKQGEYTYVLDTCFEGNTCQDIALGSVPLNDARADKTKKVDSTWDTVIVEQLRVKNLECYCQNGTEAYDSSKDGRNDVCAFKSPRCMSGAETAAFMKVGMCGSQIGGEDYPIQFKAPVVIDDPQDIKVTNANVDRTGRVFAGIGYGILRATGLRDLGYLLYKMVDCVHDSPGENAEFSQVVRYVTCAAKRACDQMPDISSVSTNWAKIGLAVTADARLVAMSISATAEIIGAQLTEALTAVTDAAAKATKEANEGVKILEDFATFAGGSGNDPFSRTQLGRRATALESSVTAANGAARSALVETADKVAALETMLDDLGVDKTSGMGKELLDRAKAIKTAADDAVAAAGRIATKVKGVNPATKLKNAFPGVSTAVSTDASRIPTLVASTGDDATRAATQIAKIIKDQDLAAKWGTGIVKIRKPVLGTAILRGAKVRAVGAIKWVGRILGKAAVIYTIIDGVSSAITYAITSTVEIEPGDYDIDKMKIASPFAIKGKNAQSGTYQAMSYMEFSSSSFVPSVANLGGLLDVSLDSTFSKPPAGMVGYTYKCDGTCSCSNNQMGDSCYCYPVANELQVQVDKAKSASSGLIAGGMTGI